MKNHHWLVLLLIGSACLPALWVRRRDRELRECQANLKNLATALEMYASGAPGLYPHNLNVLVMGRYIERVPRCPSAASDTYSASYRRTERPDAFSLGCQGGHHGPGYSPWYDAELGLTDRSKLER